MENLTMEEGEVDEVKEIELPTLKPCVICGKKVESQSDLVVCNQECLNEWKRREEEKKKRREEDKKKKIEEEKNKKIEKKPIQNKTPKENIETKKPTKTLFLKSILILICVGLFSVSLIVNIFWFNSNISDIADKNFNSTIEVNTPITVNTPTVPITNNYENNIPVNIQIDLSDEIVQRIADEVIDIINNTNFTG